MKQIGDPFDETDFVDMNGETRYILTPNYSLAQVKAEIENCPSETAIMILHAPDQQPVYDTGTVETHTISSWDSNDEDDDKNIGPQNQIAHGTSPHRPAENIYDLALLDMTISISADSQHAHPKYDGAMSPSGPVENKYNPVLLDMSISLSVASQKYPPER